MHLAGVKMKQEMTHKTGSVKEKKQFQMVHRSKKKRSLRIRQSLNTQGWDEANSETTED